MEKVIENKPLKYFLGQLTLKKLRKIGKNLRIDENITKLSKSELIEKIDKAFPKNDEYPYVYEGLTSPVPNILINLPVKTSNLISTIVLEGDIDFGIIKYKKLLEKCKSHNDLMESLKILEGYGIAFRVEERGEKYVVIPEDITSMLIDIIDEYGPPQDMSFEEFLLELSKQTLRNICKIYGLKVSGNKKEITYRILNSGLTPEDVLSVMYFDEVIDIAEELNVFPWDEDIRKKYNREVIIKKTASHIIDTLNKNKSNSYTSLKDIYQLIYEALSTKFQPILKWNSKETDIEKQLCAYLRGLFDGSNINAEVHSQYSLPSGKIDIYIPQEDIGIEIKYNPSRTYLRETVQRIKEYKEDVQRIIVIIFYNRYYDTHRDYIEKYASQLRKIKNVEVILKEV